MHYNIHMNKNHGLTLIELLVTMAVVGIVLVAGVPALNQMTDNNRLVTQINSIAGSLAVARSEAIKTGSVVTVCISSNGSSCAGVDNTDWEDGWIVFTDQDRDNVVDGGTDNIIKIEGALNGGTTLRLSLSDNAGIYQFLPDGSSLDRNLGGVTVGTFTLCPAVSTDVTSAQRLAKSKAININFIGRTTRAEGATPSEKPVHDAAGNDVTCP